MTSGNVDRSGAGASYSKGLAGVIADESSICLVDGAGGRLLYRGHEISDIVAEHGFDEVAYLMLYSHWPSSSELDGYRRAVAEATGLPPAAMAMIEAMPKDQHPMEVIQAVLPILGSIGPAELITERVDGKDGERRVRVVDLDKQREELIRVIAKIPTIVAAFHRHRQGLPTVAPRAELGLVQGFLHMFHGAAPEARDAEIFAICEILQMEHGFNASTFTCRVVASTLSPVHTALSAAVGALYGKLHGGADEAAFRMADAIGTADQVPDAIDELLGKGGKVMGMGHRVYRTIDPRARILGTLADELCASKGGDQDRVFRTLQAVEAHMAQRMKAVGKEIHPNVEFYKGPVFNALGIPSDCYTAMFVIARAFGWGAHILELWTDHRLYRPRALYVPPVQS